MHRQLAPPDTECRILTFQPFDGDLRNEVLKVDFTVGVPSSLSSIRSSGHPGRDAEPRCIQCSLDSEPSQYVEEDLDMPLWLVRGFVSTLLTGEYEHQLPA